MKLNRHTNQSDVIIAIGSNMAGRWGSSQQILTTALQRLGAAGVDVKIASSIYRTTGLGGGRQPSFLNAVIVVRPNRAPAALLRLLKSLEREAGRRLGRHWGPRSLDLDIIFQPGLRRLQHSARRVRGQLIVPHPHLAARRFVLEPLHEIAPNWQHPILHRTTRQLLSQRRIENQRRGIQRVPGTSELLMRALRSDRSRQPDRVQKHMRRPR